MLHPEREALSCEMCRRYYLDAEGKPVVLQGGRRPEYVPRTEAPNCSEECTKKLPGMEPWDDSNARFFRAYREARALGPTMAQSEDHLFRYLSGVLREHEELVKLVFQLKVMHGG